jgi:ABC-type branched-subunit amino acid transport system ATPase component/branched-subunit amino acid ABC-type transport system permease component
MDFLGTLVGNAVLALPLLGIYVLFAVGIVVIYRASRVLNLAHGALALAPAYVFYSLGKKGLPLPLALLAGVAGGVALGLLTERVVVRRLRRQGDVAQTVGTVAVYGFVVAVAVKAYGSAPLLPPRLFPAGSVSVGGGVLRIDSVFIFVIGALVTAACLALFRFTDLGLAMRAAADNRRAASLMGVDPDRTTAAAWGLGGGLAALAGVLAGTHGNIDAYTLGLQVLPAFVAALIGGLGSLSGALVGCAVVALVQAEIPALATLPVVGSLARGSGVSQLILVVVAFVVLATRGQRLVTGSVRDGGIGGAVMRRARAIGQRPRRRAGVAATVLAIALVTFPFLPVVPFSVLGDAILAGYYLLVALSVVLLTGWVGQISLAQAELVGVGAFVTALVTNRLHLPFPFSLVAGALAAGLVAVVLGAVALRVRGLYLAIATLVFAWMADSFLFHQEFLGIVGGSAQATIPSIGDPSRLPYFDFSSPTLVYLLVVAAAVWVVYSVANLADSKTGRAFFALRGSEVAAASLGIDVTRYKLLAFAVSGAIAGMAGAMLLVYQRSVEPSQFDILTSLFFLGIAVVGGVQSIGGAVLAALLFAGLSELFFRVQALAGFLDVVSASLLLLVLLVYPGGLAAILARLSDRWAGTDAWRERVAQRLRSALPRAERHEVAPAQSPPDALHRLAPPVESNVITLAVDDQDDEALAHTFAAIRRPGPRSERIAAPAVLRVAEVSVRFGGLLAVDSAALEVRQGEIVGLIGPNGAGKTTCFNAVSGLVTPTAGRVEILGVDATHLGVHRRAALGVGRTFQQIQLFPQLSVFENLLVATHLRNGSAFAGHCLALPGAIRAEVAMRARVNQVLDFLELGPIAAQPTADLPFGVLRIVELARALVTGSELLLLDEPASGLDTTESARFADLLLYVRERLGVSMLLIEHDIATVTGVSDYMYVLEQGRVIAEGLPAVVQRDAAVIEAYLGEPVGAEA